MSDKGGEKSDKKSEKLRFQEGEQLLCFHGPLIYEAKCIKTRLEEDLQYLIHYNGWSKSWDEWVPEDRLLKINEENIQKKEELAKTQKLAKKPKGGRRHSIGSGGDKEENNSRSNSPKPSLTGRKSTSVAVTPVSDNKAEKQLDVAANRKKKELLVSPATDIGTKLALVRPTSSKDVRDERKEAYTEKSVMPVQTTRSEETDLASTSKNVLSVARRIRSKRRAGAETFVPDEVTRNEKDVSGFADTEHSMSVSAPSLVRMKRNAPMTSILSVRNPALRRKQKIIDMLPPENITDGFGTQIKKRSIAKETNVDVQNSTAATDEHEFRKQVGGKKVTFFMPDVQNSALAIQQEVGKPMKTRNATRTSNIHNSTASDHQKTGTPVKKTNVANVSTPDINNSAPPNKHVTEMQTRSGNVAKVSIPHVQDSSAASRGGISKCVDGDHVPIKKRKMTKVFARLGHTSVAADRQETMSGYRQLENVNNGLGRMLAAQLKRLTLRKQILICRDILNSIGDAM